MTAPRTARIAIVGGGLAGLYAAWLLEQQGLHDWVLIEARERLGGRIASLAPGGDVNRFDLGPTWYWPALQPQLDRLVRELGLDVFEQHEQGDTVVERSPGARPMRMRGYASSPAALRLLGGMEALTDALRRRLDPARLFGPQAATPRMEALKDWAQDARTATAADLEGAAHHAAAPPAAAADGPWAGRLTGIASEWSPSFPGYLAGAVEAAQLGVAAWAGATADIHEEQS